MPRPGRQLAQLQGAQFTAQRLLADRNAKFVEHPLCEVDQPPAHHAMNRRDRTALDDLQQRLPMRLGEQRRVARCLAVYQARRPLSVECQHPVAHRLQPNAADLRRFGSRPAIVDRRQRQQAPRLIGILRPLRQLAQSRGVVIPSNPNRSSHGKPPPVCHGESHPPRFENPPRESPSWGLGISGLLGLVEMGAVELHPWGSMIDNIEHPDMLVLDLDPDPNLEWEFVVETAVKLREIFDEEGLPTWPKLTGGKGVHVVVPVEPALTWEECRAYIRAIAQRLAATSPN